MTKKYIIEQYANRLSDYRIADSDDEVWTALRGMARLERFAMEGYGFEFADSLPYLADKWLESLVLSE